MVRGFVRSVKSEALSSELGMKMHQRTMELPGYIGLDADLEDTLKT